MRNKLTRLRRNKAKHIKVARVKHINSRSQFMHLSETQSHSKEEGREKEKHPQETTKTYFQPAPPQRPAEIRLMTQTEKHPHKSTPQQRRNTPTPNTKAQNKTTTKGRGERSAKRPAHEIAPDTAPCVPSSENPYIHKTLN